MVQKSGRTLKPFFVAINDSDFGKQRPEAKTKALFRLKTKHMYSILTRQPVSGLVTRKMRNSEAQKERKLPESEMFFPSDELSNRLVEHRTLPG